MGEEDEEFKGGGAETAVSTSIEHYLEHYPQEQKTQPLDPGSTPKQAKRNKTEGQWCLTSEHSCIKMKGKKMQRKKLLFETKRSEIKKGRVLYLRKKEQGSWSSKKGGVTESQKMGVIQR